MTYEVIEISKVAANLMLDLNPGANTHALLRHGTRLQVWSFHPNERAAKAAVRRNNLRDIPTR